MLTIVLDVTEEEVNILDKEYENRGGLEKYLNYEVKDKLKDVIGRKQVEDNVLYKDAQTSVVAEIEAEALAKEAVTEPEKVV